MKERASRRMSSPFEPCSTAGRKQGRERFASTSAVGVRRPCRDQGCQSARAPSRLRAHASSHTYHAKTIDTAMVRPDRATAN
eukprot:14241989-Alexandrium_andersonii.AAC.1